MPTTLLSRDALYKKARESLTVEQYSALLETITERIYTIVVNAGDTVLDLGANSGRHTIPLANLVGETGVVHSFEVSPIVLPWLKNHLAIAKIDKRVIIHEVAVGRRTGPITFHYTHGGAYGMSGIVPRALSTELTKVVTYIPLEVRGVRLDDELADAHRISFVKLDLEGGEYDALVGGTNLLVKNKPVIVFENGRADSAAQYNYSLNEFFDLFSSVNYRLYDVFGYPFEPDDWQKVGVPWQFVGLPRHSLFLDKINEAIHQELTKASIY